VHRRHDVGFLRVNSSGDFGAGAAHGAKLPGDAGRPASTTLGSHRTLRTATVLDPAQSAQIAQARAFEKLLQAERRELQELARTTDETPDSSDACSPESRAQIRTRLMRSTACCAPYGGVSPCGIRFDGSLTD
jgi:hypothetical protein